MIKKGKEKQDFKIWKDKIKEMLSDVEKILLHEEKNDQNEMEN